MKPFKNPSKKLDLGNKTFDSNLIYAPLAEYTDYPYRRLLRDFHKGLMFCEMVKMEAFVREKSTKQLKYNQDMHPIGAQLCSSNYTIAYDCAKKIEDMGFDVLDLNSGCPVRKVVKDVSGAALLNNPLLIYKILKNMVSAVSIPVTVKIRIGWDDNNIIAKEIVQIAIDAGAKAITIHGRTKKQGYSGSANWDIIKECKEFAKDQIKVIGNGDLYTPEDIKNMFDQTNVDGAMIARGMLAHPYLSYEYENYFLQGLSQDFTVSKKDILLRYIKYLLEEKENPIYDIRRISGWFLRGYRNIKNLRVFINKAQKIEDVIKLIENFEWEKNYELSSANS